MDRCPAAHARKLETFHKVHNYYVGKEIARGSFSTVRVGFEKSTRKPVAIKVISKRKLSSINGGSNILFSETYISPLLVHPHICQVYDIIEAKGQNEGQIFQVMDRFEGDLLDVLRRVDLKFSQRLQIAADVLSGLEYLHSHRVCHRDLKIENILIDSAFRAYLSDFGLSCLCDSKVTGSVGSMGYAPAEVFSDSPYDGTAADIWSLGILLYCLFSGRCPLNPITDSDELDFGLLPFEVRNIICMCLKKDPKARPTASSLRCLGLFRPYFENCPDRQIFCSHSSSVQSPDPIDAAIISEALGQPYESIAEQLGKKSISKATILYWLLDDFHRAKLQKVPSSAELTHYNSAPIGRICYGSRRIQVGSHAAFLKSFESIKKFFLSSNFCLSYCNNGCMKAVLNRVDDDIVVDLSSATTESGVDIIISSDDDFSGEVAKFVERLREAIVV